MWAVARGILFTAFLLKTLFEHGAGEYTVKRFGVTEKLLRERTLVFERNAKAFSLIFIDDVRRLRRHEMIFKIYIWEITKASDFKI